MKCVKNLNTDEIKRVTEDRASSMVNLGTWKYVPKSEWKAVRVLPPVVVPEAAPKESQEQKKARQFTKKKAYRDARKAARIAKKVEETK